MIWIVLFAVGAGILAFWPIYDWIKARKTELQKDLGTTGQPVSDSWIKREIWDCPVCGKDHGGNRRERNRENCPFADGDYYHVWEEHLLNSTVTNFGGHFGLPYIVWEYDSKVYLTYKPDPSAVKTFSLRRTPCRRRRPPSSKATQGPSSATCPRRAG